jgi:serine/threonine protein kinase
MVVDKTKEAGTSSINDFVLLQVIGKGSYGKVYLVKKKDSGKHYALKILKKEEIIRKK